MTALQDVLAVTKELLALVPDEGKREALEQQLQAAQDEPTPEPDIVEGAISAAQIERLKTAVELLKGITGETTQESADNVIDQAVIVLKALTSSGYEKPDTDIDYGGADKPEVKIDESFKGGTPGRVQGRLLEAVAGTKNRFKVCIVESGESLNGVVYPLPVLQSRVEYYNNRPMYVDHTLQESGGSPSLKGDVSTIVNARVDDGYDCSNGSKGAILAEAVIHNQDWLTQVLVPEFRQRLGISHVVQAKTREGVNDGRSVRIAEDIMPERVDWVSREGAGGRVLEHAKGKDKMTQDVKIDEGLSREVRRLRAKDEAREILTLSESLDPQTKNEIVQEVGDIAEKSDKPIDVKTITEAIQKRNEGVIERATKKDSPIMPGAAGRPAIGKTTDVEKASNALGKNLYGSSK